MPASLHLIFVDALPMAEGDDEEVVMVETDDAQLPPDGERRMEDYGFVTTVLANYDDLAQLQHDVHDWWQEAAGVEPTMEFLTSEAAMMSDETRKAAIRLESGYWNMSAFVGFLRQSTSARSEARRLVVESCMKVQ